MTVSRYPISDLDIIQSAIHSVGPTAIRYDVPTVVIDALLTVSLGQGL